MEEIITATAVDAPVVSQAVREYFIEEGWIITVSGILIVFLAMALLALLFMLVSRLQNRKRSIVHMFDHASGEVKSVKVSGGITGEMTAVVAAAIHAYMNDAKDEENAVVTIARVPKAYSPWSSKIYAANRNIFQPRRY